MPARYFVNIANSQLYLDRDGRRCQAPGSRPPGRGNTVYFLLSKATEPLVDAEWDPALRSFSMAERRCGTLWEKDYLYELGERQRVPLV